MSNVSAALRCGSNRLFMASPPAPHPQHLALALLGDAQGFGLRWRDVPPDHLAHHVAQYPRRQRIQFDAVTLESAAWVLPSRLVGRVGSR